MSWIIVSALLGLIATVALVAAFTIDTGEGSDPDSKLAVNGARWIAGGCIVFFFAWTAWSCFQNIDVGRVGMTKAFGSLGSNLEPGPHVIAPWADVVSFDTRVKQMDFNDQKGDQPPISAFSSETQNVQVKLTLNYHVAAGDVRELYRRVGSNFTQLIPSRVNQVVKDETVKFTAVDLAPHREDLRQAIRTRLGQELAPFSINVDDVNITNISFSPQFEAAIEAKQEATQATLKAQQEVQTAKAKADAAIKTAEGQAGVLRATAQGQADANKTLTASLTPELIQYTAIQKLNPNVQVMMVPSGSGTLFQLPQIGAAR